MKLITSLTLRMLTSLCVVQPISAQIALETPFEKADRILKNSSIIFEGVIVDQQFYESTPRNCWTASRVVITRIFKAPDDFVCGEALLVSRGSSGQWVDFGQGEYNQPAGFHSISFQEGAQGIFFCKLNNEFYPKPPSNPTSNPFVRSSFEQSDNFLAYTYDPRLFDTVSLSTINHYAEQFAGMTFNSFSEIGAFLKTKYDLDSANFVKCDIKSDGMIQRIDSPDRPVLVNPKDYPDLYRDNNGIENRDDSDAPKDDSNVQQKGSGAEIERIEKSEDNSGSQVGVKKKILEFEYLFNERLKTSLAANVSRANEELTFTLENEKFTGSNPRYFEFDVVVECNTSGTFLENAPIHLSYNTNAFGSNIVANNKITVTKGSAFIDPTYEDPNLLSNDWASDTVVVLLGLDYGFTGTVNRTQVPTTSTTMLHVKIEIASCYQETDMFFVNQSIAPNVTVFTTTANQPLLGGSVYPYDDVHYNGNLDLVLCKPVITSFTTPIHAGIGDVLTITGKHFGNSRGNGEVWLTDAKWGGQYMYKKQDPVDYSSAAGGSWSDTEIKVRIPSRVMNTMVNGNTVYPGTGLIGVKTDLGDSVKSTTPLEVLYAIYNSDYYPSANDKLRFNLIDDNGQGSYTFRCDTSISNYPIRKAIIERAIHDWNCRTDVNWILGSDTTLQATQADGVNLIYFDSTLHGAPLAEANPVDAGVCPTLPTGQFEAFPVEIDIRFSRYLDLTTYFSSGGWWYDTTGATVPANYLDFYGEALHELGHAHGMRHVNDQNDPMFYTPGSGFSSIPGFNRRYQPSKWYNLIDAGVDVVSYSEAILYNCPSVGASHLVSKIASDCSVIDKVREIFSQTGLKVYPNPTRSVAYVNVISDNLESMKLYSISGTLIYDFNFTKEAQDQEGNIYLVNLESVPQGVYLLKIAYDGKSETQRIIKQ